MRGVFITIAMFLGGLYALLVFPAVEAGAGGGGHGSCVPTPRDGTDEPVIIEGTCYEPAVLYVEPGANVEWQQRDVIPHNVTLFGGELVGDDAEMSKGDKVSRRFDAPGVFAYYCSVHPSMVGMVVVGDQASPEFGASLSVQTSAEDLRAITDYKEEWLAEFQESNSLPVTLAAGNGKSAEAGDGGGNVPVGLGLIGGALVGLVVAGGGLRFVRRGR